MDETKNKVLINLCGFLILFGASISSVSAQTDKRIEAIRQVYKETNERIAQCKAPDESESENERHFGTVENCEAVEMFLSEFVVNKNGGSYPAVGNFRTVYKFYYSYGDREKNPYPDRLLKIEVETSRSATVEKYEYLFNENAQLIFYFESISEEEQPKERRFYFTAEKPIRILTGEKNVSLANREAIESAKNILGTKRKLIAMFQNSLNY